MEIQVRDRTALLSDEDWPRVQALLNAGHRLLDMDVEPPRPGEFVYIAIFRESRYVTLLGRWLLEAPRHLVVEYRNRNTLDMRRENIRLCTLNEVQWNRRPRQDVQFKGIEFDKRWGRWRAKIRLNGKRKRVGGSHATAEEAARAYDAACIQHFGADHSRLNFPIPESEECKGND